MIDEQKIEAISLVVEVSQKLHVPFVLVGATAREVFFSTLFNIPTTRATMDIDFAVRLRNWEEFNVFKDTLIQTKLFETDKKIPHRFPYQNGTIVDIIPFGGIENPAGTIQWPEDETIMSTIGCVDIFNSAILVRLHSEPAIDIYVATAAGLAIMKIISWNERYPERKKDAEDLLFILKKYIDAGNDHRLYDTDRDIVVEQDFDYSRASPRLLGRDIASIAGETTYQTLIDIIDGETREDSNFRLAQDMIRGSLSTHEDFETILTLLKQMKRGIQEGKK